MASVAPAPSTARPAPAGERKGIPGRSGKFNRVDPVFYAFLLPALVLFTIAITVPAITGIVYSFTNSIGFGESEFIGFLNYAVLFSDPAVLSSYGFTLGFSVVTVVLVNLIAFFLALGLTSRIRFRNALRSTFVIPMVVSGIIIAYVFQYLFSNSLPQLGQAISNPVLSQSILANADLAWIGVVLVTAWQAVPSALLIYIAGLLSIPGDVYEAAQIDGASGRQRLWSITLPLVAGYIVINVIVGFKNFINSYDIIVGLTNGGPGTATRSVAMTIFTGFTGGDYAYQMANAAIFFLIAIAIAVLQLRVTRGRAAIR